MVTVGLTFLMGIMGLVVDVGWGYFRKQVGQAAVDSAVMAAMIQATTLSNSTLFNCGSNGVVCQDPTPCTAATAGTVIATACQYAIKNGVAADKIYISANTTSPHNGVAVSYWLTATTSEGLSLGFLHMLGVSSATVAASASAGVIVHNGSGGGCLYALDPRSTASLHVGGASLTSSCGIYVNSNDSAALKVNGNNSFAQATGGAPINVVGGWSCTNGCAYVQPTPITGVATVEDPLAALPAPPTGACTVFNFNQTSNSASTTLDPGTYCGGIKISGGTVTFNPGTYILNGGGFSVQGNNTTVSGSNVFFYNTSSGYSFGNLAISGQPTVTLSPPTTGTYQGILYFRDRTLCPSTNDAMTGNSNSQVSGTLYVHCGKTDGSYVPAVLNFAGQSTPGHYVGLVADDVAIVGNSNLILDPTGGSNTGIKPTTKTAELIQ